MSQPAFPTFAEARVYYNDADRTGRLSYVPTNGMSLRDYFASQAIGFVSIEDGSVMDVDKLARWAYELADAMLREREKQP